MKRTKLFLKSLLFAALIIFSAQDGYATNLKLTNIEAKELLATYGALTFRMNVSWDHSWNDSGEDNYDAIWIFMKYSLDGGETWHHASITGGGNESNYSIEVPSDYKGIFLYNADSVYTNTTHTITASDMFYFAWSYRTDGVTDADVSTNITTSSLKIKVFGIEMVHIPTASFYAGDGNGSAESFKALHITNNTAFQITTSPSTNVTVDSSVGDLVTSPITVDGDGGITGNANWPVGYREFYLMKYEITEGQWVEFFNTLTQAQKENHDVTGVNGKNSDSMVSRNSISWSGSGDATTTRPSRGMSFIAWQDVAAYADWSGLRPVTELEYEKAARGPTSAVLAELAWGSTSATGAATISGTENGTETITTSNANYHNFTTLSGGDGGNGQLRVGIFAKSATTRTQAGAGYYGNLDLTGNAWENVVALDTPTGRAFQGTHGDGVLTETEGYEGYATNTDWPGINSTTSRGVTSAGPEYAYIIKSTSGISYRGGYNTINQSDRAYYYGGRLARTAS